jgi:hypothetical protein
MPIKDRNRPSACLITRECSFRLAAGDVQDSPPATAAKQVLRFDLEADSATQVSGVDSCREVRYAACTESNG